VPKYLIRANYTVEGAQGLKRQGGTARRAAVERMFAALGGRVESFYYAFGDTDAFIVVEAPDAVTLTAISVAVNASGGASASTTPLFTPEEMDEACKKVVDYSPPGR
jgi:uncharacterized protein with GYD domain